MGKEAVERVHCQLGKCAVGNGSGLVGATKVDGVRCIVLLLLRYHWFVRTYVYKSTRMDGQMNTYLMFIIRVNRDCPSYRGPFPLRRHSAS